MKLARVRTADGPRWGRIEAQQVALLTGSIRDGFTDAGTTVPLDAALLLAPVVPGKIVALGHNYPKHAAEMNKPVPKVPKLFIKPNSAIIGPGEPIRIPPGTERVDPECEIAVVIRDRLFCASPAQAMAGVLGYTALNDVTARDLQRQDGVYTRAKGFDSFCPVGPWIETELDPSDVGVRTIVNGEVRAAGRISQMVFSIPFTLSFISQVMTLNPGDVVTTGTPPGVRPIDAGDVVDIVVDGIGTLSNPVVYREDR